MNNHENNRLPSSNFAAIAALSDRFNRVWRDAFRSDRRLPKVKDFIADYPGFADDLAQELVTVDHQNRCEFKAEMIEASDYIDQLGEQFENAVLQALGSGEADAAPHNEPADAPDFIADQYHPQRYRFGELLGQGGFGSVYRARDQLLEREVAIKILKKQQQNCLPEARSLAAAAPHPNVVTLHDAMADVPIQYVSGVTLTEACLVMEFVAGRSLVQQMDIGATTPANAVKITRQIADGVRHAHEAGIFHRDLKPGNVLLTADQTAKIVDFGLAANLQAGQRPGVAGTLAYMAPEQFAGGAATSRSDIWSVGVILFQMLNERLPYEAKTKAELRYAIQNSSPATCATTVPPGLSEICERCLQKEPAHRYGSAEELVAALSHALTAVSSPAVHHVSGGISDTKKAHGGVQPSTASKPESKTGNEQAILRSRKVKARSNAGRLVLGREEETHEIVQELLDGTHPVVVLYGSPGAGKTTLAREVLQQLSAIELSLYRVDLSERDIELNDVLKQVKTSFDMPLDAGATASAIKEMLRQQLLESRPSILVVENFEQVLKPAQQEFLTPIVDIDDVKTLVTSRSRFSLNDAEPWLFRVEPLAAPSTNEANRLPVEELESRFTSVQLFIKLTCDSPEGGQQKRLIEARDEATIRTVARICAMLDGYPGAIECVAKRARRTSIQRLIERINDYKRKLRYSMGGSVEADNSNCMEIAVRSIYDGLPAADKQAFLQIVQFDGGFDEELADGVLAGVSVNTDDVLARLEANGLLRRRMFDSISSPATFADSYWDVYLPIKECGRELLKIHQNYDALTAGFGQGVVRSCLKALNEEVRPHAEFLQRVDHFRDVFEQATRILVAQQRGEEAVRLLYAMADSYFARGPASELISIAADAGECLNLDTISPAVTTIHHLLSNACRLTGDYPGAYTYAVKANASSKQLSEDYRDLRARCLIGLATCAGDIGEPRVYNSAVSELLQSVDEGQFDSADTACNALIAIAFQVERSEGFDVAVDLLDRADRLAKRNVSDISIKCQWRMGACRGQLLSHDGRLQDALAQQENNLEFARQNAMNDRYLGGSYTNRALTLVDLAEFKEARKYAQRGRDYLRKADTSWLAVNLVAEAAAILYAGVHGSSIASSAAREALEFIAVHERTIRNSRYGITIGLGLAVKGESLRLLRENVQARNVLLEAREWCQQRPGCPTFERSFRVSVLLADLDYKGSGPNREIEQYLEEAKVFVEYRKIHNREWPVKRTTDLLKTYVELRNALENGRNDNS